MLTLKAKVSLWVLGMVGSAFLVAANADDINHDDSSANDGDCMVCSFFESIQTGEGGGSVAIAIGDSVAVSDSNIACPPGSEDQDITQTLGPDSGSTSYSYASDGGVVINGESVTGDACGN